MSLITQADVAVVGGGAAGLAAAIFAGEATQGQARSIVILDGAKQLGAKILVSGGGRCNVTHRAVGADDLFGPRVLVRNILASFPVEDTRNWFASLGVDLKEEDTGKLFPVTDKARTVLDALLRRCREVQVTIRTHHRVTVIDRDADGSFVIGDGHSGHRARKVILATGGQSLPKSGSDGTGWRLAKALGHSVTPVAPALVPLELEPQYFHATLAGVSHTVELTTLVEGARVDQRTGDLLWTHTGVSGPVVMDASRFWTLATQAGERVELRCHFVPGRSREELEAEWLERVATQPRVTVKTVLGAYVTERLAAALLHHCQVDPLLAASQLPKPSRKRLLEALTALVLPVARDRGWTHAEVTAGGVPLEEVNFRTMESKHVPGLYLIGEMLNCDGRIGGFNFQWAWATGRLAGRAAAAALTPRPLDDPSR